MIDQSEVTIKLSCLSAALVLQNDLVATTTMEDLREAGVKRESVREAILQTYLFDGYPTALEGMVLLARVWQGTPDPVEKGDFANWREWEKRGWELYSTIYGDVADKLQLNARAATPELARWMIVEGYGKVLSRGNLDVVQRESINAAVLTVKQRPRQLRSHLRGALRVGAGSELLTNLLTSLATTLDAPGVQAATSILHELLNEKS